MQVTAEDKVLYVVAEVRRLRHAIGYSQQRAALLLGVKRETLSYIETHKQKITLEMVFKMAEVYEVPTAKLLMLWKWEMFG